jgi:NifU-like protein involved in Fe-S cluster formation
MTDAKDINPGREPDGIGRAASDCGDLVELDVWTSGKSVARAEFRVEGCSNTLAAAAAAAALAEGRSFGEILGLQPDDVLDRIAGLPEGARHVADLAVAALHAAVLDAIGNQAEPWKRAYRSRTPM